MANKPIETVYSLPSSLVGATIKEVDVDAEGYPYIHAEKNGSAWTIYISRDEEQNGPGAVVVFVQGKVVSKNES